MKSNKVLSTTTTTMYKPHMAWFEYMTTPKEKYILGIDNDGKKVWSTDYTAGWTWSIKTGSGWTVTVTDRQLRFMNENKITWHELQRRKWEEPELPVYHYLDIPLHEQCGYRMYSRPQDY